MVGTSAVTRLRRHRTSLGPWAVFGPYCNRLASRPGTCRCRRIWAQCSASNKNSRNISGGLLGASFEPRSHAPDNHRCFRSALFQPHLRELCLEELDSRYECYVLDRPVEFRAAFSKKRNPEIPASKFVSTWGHVVSVEERFDMCYMLVIMISIMSATIMYFSRKIPL